MTDTTIAEVQGIQESHLYAFLKSHNWDPFFLSNIDRNVFDHDSEVLDRELEVCSLNGEQTLIEALRRYLEKHDCADKAKKLKQDFDMQSVAHCLKADVDVDATLPLVQQLMAIIAFFECEPVVLKVNAEKNLARDCGREMKHWREQEKHELVVLLGELASQKGLQNQRVSNNLRLSRLSLERARTIQFLQAVKESPNRSRDFYEGTIINAWINDPDCSGYLELLRKVIAFRLQKQDHVGQVDDFREERVDHIINQRLWREISS